MWENEEVLPDMRILEAVAARFPLALYTGRNPGEARLAQNVCKLKIPDSLCWVADGRPGKPDPAGLIWLCHELLKGTPRGSQILFIGDTADDHAASRAAQDRGAPIVYAHVEAPGDTLGRRGVPIVILGKLPATQMRGDTVMLAVEPGRKSWRFRTCASEEGIHTTAWSGLPLASPRRWHAYYYLGYDVDPDCTPADFAPDSGAAKH